MIVTAVLIVAMIIAFFIPREFLGKYFIIASVGISLAYLSFNPPYDYDLYRHYALLDTLKHYSLKDIFLPNSFVSMGLLRDYSVSAKVYLLLAYLIGKINIPRLLPFLAGIVIYGFSSRIIILQSKSFIVKGEKVESWKMAVCFCFLLALADFRSVSGIRNMMAYALFAFMLYLDLVKYNNKYKILFFAGYVVLAGIHAAIIPFIAVRLILELTKVIPAWIISIYMLLSYTFINSSIKLLEQFSSVPFVSILIFQIEKYAFGSITDYNVRNVIVRGIIIVIYCLIYFYVRSFYKIDDGLKRYGCYFSFSAMLTLGSISQYDIFIRNDLLLLFLILPFLLFFLHYSVGITPNFIRCPGNVKYEFITISVYAAIILAIIVSLSFYSRFFYGSMDPFFFS